MRPPKLGSVNPCGWATIYAGRKAVATCLDTPVARATAFRLVPESTHALAFYPGWKPIKTERHDWTHYMSARDARFKRL